MPTTDAGKAIAARNATTHGVFSHETVLPHLGEDPALFDALLENLQNELRPRSRVQEHQVRQIAQALWRLRRLETWEQKIVADPELLDAERQKQWERALRLDNMLRRQIDRAYKLLTVERKEANDAARRRFQEGIDSGEWLWTKEEAAARAASSAPAPEPVGETARTAVSISALRHARQNRAQRRQAQRERGGKRAEEAGPEWTREREG